MEVFEMLLLMEYAEAEGMSDEEFSRFFLETLMLLEVMESYQNRWLKKGEVTE